MVRCPAPLRRVATALAVVLLAAGCASAADRARPGSPGFVGYAWRIVAVTRAGHVTTIAARTRGSISFTAGRRLAAYDGVNDYSGPVRLEKGGYRPGEVAVSAVGYVGHDPSTLALIGAVAALTAPRHVAVAVGGDTATLTAGGYVVRCVRAGSASAPPSGAPTSAASSSVTTSSAGDRVAVTVAGGCPAGLGGAADVANDPAGLRDRLLPSGAVADVGLVCAYRGTEAPATGHPTGRARLGTGAAVHLAAVIGRVSLTRPTGTYSCPAQFAGTDTVLAFHYRSGRTVDLWYLTSGCRTLDNGYTTAYQVAGGSFAAFEAALAAATR